ncbi:Uncharacterised protein [Vibrio cholerae]|nr:Uncharacterised protein [Vibrio cholerae]
MTKIVNVSAYRAICCLLYCCKKKALAKRCVLISLAW